MKNKIGNYFENETSATVVVGNGNVVNSPNARTFGFTNPLLQGLVTEDNKTTTENGAATYSSTLNYVLDLFALGAALRTRQDSEVISLFSKAFSQDRLLAVKCLFNIRNVRGGAGERKVFRTVLKWLGENYTDVAVKNIGNVVHFGRFDDLFVLLDTPAAEATLEYIATTINNDVERYNKDESISLAAKWMPSINTSSQETIRLANVIRKSLGWNAKQYRKTLSALRSYSNVVEVKTSAGKWSEIDYSHVPSKANLKYKKAFSTHDPKRYVQFIEDVKNGKKKINASALFPYEIVEKALTGDSSQTLDVLWDALPNYLEDSTRNILVVADVSGSMSGRPMAISISLAMYTAERNQGPFAGHFFTFSDTPKLQAVVGNNVRERVNNLSRAELGMSTNLQSVFATLLKTAVYNRVAAKDMPAQILIVSDMEFNACTNESQTNFDAIRQTYKSHGYEAPQLVFWNVKSSKNNVPVTADQRGVLLVSGASPSVFKTLLSGNQYTPVDQMLETLNQEAYDRVTV